MISAYANVSNVAGGQEEIVLLFGMNQSWQAGQKEIKIQLSDRIVLSPFAAKRLANLLKNVLANYEAQYGKLGLEPRRPPTTTVFIAGDGTPDMEQIVSPIDILCSEGYLFSLSQPDFKSRVKIRFPMDWQILSDQLLVVQ